MKAYKLVLIGFGLTFCLLTWVGFSQVEASEYIGDFCWQSYDTEEGKLYIAKVGVFNMGGGHFFLSGKLTLIGTSEESVLQGNAEFLSDNKIHLTIVNPGSNEGGAWNTITHFVLDSKLNGTGGGITTLTSSDNTYQKIEYSNDILTFIKCP